jgi:two-component system, NtrC family, sensor kinase
MLKDFLSQFNPVTRNLRTQLALYFIPVSILPAVAISFYATRVFEETTRDSLVKRAASERDAIVGEIGSWESELLNEAKGHAASARLLRLVREENAEALSETFSSYRSGLRVRVYTASGRFLAKREEGLEDPQIPFIGKEGREKLNERGESVERFFLGDDKGFLTVVRVLLKDKQGTFGILEEELSYSLRELTELKNRRQVDVAFLDRAFRVKGWSVALPAEQIKEVWSTALQPTLLGKIEPLFVKLGDTRYATFLYDLPMPLMKRRDWGYLAVFIPMSSVDALTLRLKTNMIFINAILIWAFALLIFFFSNRIVKPIEMLVLAMKRVKTGRGEEIPPLDSTYEIEYLVHAFNDMTRNVSDAKRALEQKLEELRRANEEIRNTQTTLVQSAKMISLGQIVAGVAHELNNPIGFIHSNVHHLGEYLSRFKQLVQEYRKIRDTLPASVQAELKSKEEALEIDYILKDMEELIRSVVDGANRTKDIVVGLRTFSRMDEASFRRADLHEGLRSTVKLLSAEFKNKVQIHEDLGVLPLVECSLSQLNQVFMNLLTNAAQAIEGRGDIWIRTRHDGDFVVIEVEDNGSGIPAAVLEKIFDPFFTTKKVGQGTGLGLSIAYGLIQKHHGSIDVKSRPGKGTRFTIRLPVRQVQKAVG